MDRNFLDLIIVLQSFEVEQQEVYFDGPEKLRQDRLVTKSSDFGIALGTIVLGMTGLLLVRYFSLCQSSVNFKECCAESNFETLQESGCWELPSTESMSNSNSDILAYKYLDCKVSVPGGMPMQKVSEYVKENDPRLNTPVALRGRTFVALVDTGAQGSCISLDLVKKAGLEWAVIPDEGLRFGIGIAKKVGDIFCNLEILGTDEKIPSKITVVEGSPYFLLGMDILSPLHFKYDANTEILAFEFPTGVQKAVKAIPGSCVGNLELEAQESWKNLHDSPKSKLKETLENEKKKFEIMKKKESKLRKSIRKQDQETIGSIGHGRGDYVVTPNVQVCVGGEKLTALVDTGAVHSCISKSIVARCGFMSSVEERSSVVHGIGECKSSGIWNATVEIGGAFFRIDFLVLNEEAGGDNMLIGQNWIKPAKALLSFKGPKPKMQFHDGIGIRCVPLAETS